MKERPILFSGPLVPPILVDAKTQTRRLVTPQPETAPLPREEWGRERGLAPLPAWLFPFRRRSDEESNYAIRCPYGTAGDRLWVKETWQTVESLDDVRPIQLAERVPIRYVADGAVRGLVREPWGKTRVSIHMPRFASRVTLEVVKVRLERLQDITEQDAKAEGVRSFFAQFPNIGREQRITSGERAIDAPFRASFACKWDEINGDRGLWKSNPWVWVVEFTRAIGASKAAA